jgi:predicted nucleotidyltransferase
VIDQKLVGTIVDRILSATQPRQIILFGSAATDNMTRDSDLDLLVIEECGTNSREESRRLRYALRDLGMPVDVFAMTPERFEETKDVIGGLAYPANKYGRVIYEAA